MKNKLTKVIFVVILIFILGIVWYKVPTNMKNISVDDVAMIYIFDGNSGTEIEITDKNDIKHIISNLNEITLKKRGISQFRMGYGFKTTIYLSDGKKANCFNGFIINSSDTIRKDPFFYIVENGKVDYDYIKDLVDKSKE